MRRHLWSMAIGMIALVAGGTPADAKGGRTYFDAIRIISGKTVAGKASKLTYTSGLSGGAIVKVAPGRKTVTFRTPFNINMTRYSVGPRSTAVFTEPVEARIGNLGRKLYSVGPGEYLLSLGSTEWNLRAREWGSRSNVPGERGKKIDRNRQSMIYRWSGRRKTGSHQVEAAVVVDG